MLPFAHQVERQACCNSDKSILSQVFQALKASSQIADLLKTIEGDLLRYQAQPGRRPDGVYAEVLPFLAEQQQQWQSFATAGLTMPEMQVKLQKALFCHHLGFFYLHRQSACQSFPKWGQECLVRVQIDCCPQHFAKCNSPQNFTGDALRSYNT